MKRNLQYNLIRLFRSRKKSHDIAMGLSLGFFPCWFPTFGAGALVSVAITKLLKGNAVAALVAAGIGSFLWPVLFYLNYLVGGVFNSGLKAPPDLDNIGPVDGIEKMNYTRDIGGDFFAGAVINSILFLFISYFLSYIVFKKYRKWVLHRLRSR